MVMWFSSCTFMTVCIQAIAILWGCTCTEIDLLFYCQIVRVELQGAAAYLYSRLVSLVLLLVEGN